jgi:hypothetical protein
MGRLDEAVDHAKDELQRFADQLRTFAVSAEVRDLDRFSWRRDRPPSERETSWWRVISLSATGESPEPFKLLLRGTLIGTEVLWALTMSWVAGQTITVDVADDQLERIDQLLHVVVDAVPTIVHRLRTAT